MEQTPPQDLHPHARPGKSVSNDRGSLYRRRGKRGFDLAVLVLTAPFTIPAIMIVALIVRLTTGGPVLFRQQRIGRMGVPFDLIKFRTMSDARDETGALLSDDQRLTGVGRVLRKTSLDELPQILNVLRGEMSLVGPRPLLVEYLPRYSPEQARRHQVRPGITGWAQVNGRNAVDWEDRFRLDSWYVDHVSFWRDLRIISMTIHQVLSGRGISAAGHVTMPEFTGSDGE
jgi:sugar transferase EpsL